MTPRDDTGCTLGCVRDSCDESQCQCSGECVPGERCEIQWDDEEGR